MTMAEIEAIEMPDATTQPHAYRAALLAVIGDRDPLEVMAETPGRVRALAQDRSAGDLEGRSGDGEWSAAEVIGHLVDVEIVFGFRLRLVLTEDRPSYPGYDEKLWSRLPKPPSDQMHPLLDGLRVHALDAPLDPARGVEPGRRPRRAGRGDGRGLDPEARRSRPGPSEPAGAGPGAVIFGPGGGSFAGKNHLLTGSARERKVK
jgi:hypothetical protein